MKGEDILERGLVPEEGWMGQAKEPRLLGRGAQASTGGAADIQGWGMNHHVNPYSVSRVCRALSYPPAPEQEAGLHLHVRSEGRPRQQRPFQSLEIHLRPLGSKWLPMAFTPLAKGKFLLL